MHIAVNIRTHKTWTYIWVAKLHRHATQTIQVIFEKVRHGQVRDTWI